MSADPFVLVHNALFNAIKGSVAVQNVVTNFRKNVIAFNETKNNPVPDVTDESSLPQILQLASGNQTLLVASSTHCDVSKTYRLELNSGAHNVVNVLLPLEFALICTLLNLNFSGVLESLEWKSQTGWATDLEIVAVAEGRSNLVANRGIEGWTAIWDINLIMHLQRQDMIEFALTGE